MTLEQLRKLLNKKFPEAWAFYLWPKGNDNKPKEYLILSYVDANISAADDEMHQMQERYQLIFYTTDYEKDIDEFFFENNIILSSKQKFNLPEFEINQVVYEFYLNKKNKEAK